MKNLKILLAFVSIGILGFFVGRFNAPKQTTTKIEETKRTDTIKNVDKKETILPDGTKITETKSSTTKITDSKVNVEVKEVARPSWKGSVIYFPKISNIQNEEYVLTVERRIFSETYLGLSYSTENKIGASLSIGF